MKKSILFITSFIFLFFFLGCQKQEKNMQTILQLNFEAEPYSLDPRLGTNVTSQSMIRMLFEGLMKIGIDGKVCLGLAKKYEVSDDQTEYTFTLNKTVWSNGDPLTAHDFVFAWKSVFAPNSLCRVPHFFYPIKNAKAIKEGKKSIDTLKVFAKDEYTLIIELDYPTPYFIEMLANPALSPLHKNHIDFTNHKFVSNGPFCLVSYQENKEAKLTQNPYYHRTDLVNLDGIHISFIKDIQTALYMFNLGRIDFLGNPISRIPFEEEKKLLDKSKLYIKPVAGIFWLGFNTESFPLNNVNFRKALAYSLDRQAISKFLHAKRPAYTFVPLEFWDKEKKYPLEHDKDLAKKYLDKALEEIQIQREDLAPITLSYCMRIGCGKNFALLLKEQWEKKLAIKIKLEELEFNNYLGAIFGHKLQMGALPWYSYMYDPLYHLETFEKKSYPANWTLWEDADYQMYLNKIRECANLKNREKLAQKAQDLLAEQMPITPLYYSDYRYIHQSNVKKIVITDLGEIEFRYCEIVDDCLGR